MLELIVDMALFIEDDSKDILVYFDDSKDILVYFDESKGIPVIIEDVFVVILLFIEEELADIGDSLIAIVDELIMDWFALTSITELDDGVGSIDEDDASIVDDDGATVVVDDVAVVVVGVGKTIVLIVLMKTLV